VLRSLASVQRGIAPALASVIDEVAKGQSRLVVSGTSWTPDEDFGVLLDAVAKLDNHALATPSFPSVTFIITGRGPLRDQYLAKAAQIGLRRMSIHSAWLSAEDYPRLLGAADLGVSLHSSSSGLDLPMKMLDMYGTGLPVCAHNFAWCAACFIRAKLILSVCSLDELLVPGQNGTAFTTSEELFTQLKVRLPPGCHRLIVNAGVA
jgi:beta-1,4-mannosyltransferase